MPRRYSDAFGVSSDALRKEGAFDGFVDIDAKFHIDPHLLVETSVPELHTSYHKLQVYFGKILILLNASHREGDLAYRQATKMLELSEFPHVSLGYGSGVNSTGSGVGSILARKVAETAFEIVKAGINEPVIFELIGLFTEGIGADRISDMVARIIAEDLLKFSARVAASLNTPTTTIGYRTAKYQVPFDSVSRRPILLVPEQILRHLPIANDWSEVDYVCAYNATLRDIVNQLVGESWKAVTAKLNKTELKELALLHPELLDDLVQQYQAKPAQSYDFDRDPEGIITWYELAQEWAADYPLQLESGRDISPDEIRRVVWTIAKQFGFLVEKANLNEFFFSELGQLKPEHFAKRLFYGIADTYCRASGLRLTVEPDGDRGAILFRLGRATWSQVPVIVKYSTSPHLRRMYEEESLNYSSSTSYALSLFVVVRTSSSEEVIGALRQSRELARNGEGTTPDLMIVDGQLRPETSLSFQAQEDAPDNIAPILPVRPNTAIPCDKEDREQWYEYKFVCDEVFTGIKFTHRDLGEALGLSWRTARNYYNEWLPSIDQDVLIAKCKEAQIH